MIEGIYNFFTSYISDPISQAYQGSVVQSAVNTVGSVLDYELYRGAGDEGSRGQPKTVGGVLKNFAGGFLNVGQTLLQKHLCPILKNLNIMDKLWLYQYNKAIYL